VEVKSAAQSERDGFFWFGHCYRGAGGCVKDAERAKYNFLLAAELGHVRAMVLFGGLRGKVDPQRFVWFGRAAFIGLSFSFLYEMSDQIHKCSSGTGHSTVVFVIGLALKGQVDNEKRTLFGSDWNFDICIGPTSQALHFYNFQLQSYRKAVDVCTIIGLRNKVVKDI
jgi:TPR repeat protein